MDSAYQKFNNEVSETATTVIPSTLSIPNGVEFGEENIKNKRIRLRVVENESDYFLKMMNVRTIRRLTTIQMAVSATIFICQVLLYASDDYHRAISIVGIAVWGPLLFFSVAGGLSWLSTKKPSGCSIGTSMGFQITSAIIACITVIFAIISLATSGRRYYYLNGVHDLEIFARVLLSMIVVSSGTILVLGIFISVQFCRVTCCTQLKVNECTILDIEATK